jgi:hypothetical protein
MKDVYVLVGRTLSEINVLLSVFRDGTEGVVVFEELC